MAELDVSELFTDPDFVDEFVVVRRTQVVEPGGRSFYESSSDTVIGSVQPASGRMLEFIADASRVIGAIEVYTSFALQEPSEGKAADQIEWLGQRYIVVRLDPYQNFGQGYTHAVCTLQALAGPTTERNS